VEILDQTIELGPRRRILHGAHNCRSVLLGLPDLRSGFACAIKPRTAWSSRRIAAPRRAAPRVLSSAKLQASSNLRRFIRVGSVRSVRNVRNVRNILKIVLTSWNITTTN